MGEEPGPVTADSVGEQDLGGQPGYGDPGVFEGFLALK